MDPSNRYPSTKMFRLSPLLFIALLGLSSLVKSATQPKEYTSTFKKLRVPYTHSFLYYPYIIQHLQRSNYLIVPMVASNSAFLDQDNYGSHNNIENVQYKRHSKSVFIVYPENQSPPTQPCNLDITESYTTVPPPTTVVGNIQTCDHPSDEHSTTTIWPLTTPSTPTTDQATSPQPTDSWSPSTSSDTIQPTSPFTATIETKPTLTTSFSISTSGNPTKATTPITMTTIGETQTTTNTINPNQVTSTTSHPETPSTNKTPTIPSTRTTISPPTTKDPTGTGKMQCSFNGLYRANNFTCDQYLVCINGATYLMDCPNGLAFNDDKRTCDWAGNVEGCNPRAFENIECPYDIPDESDIISTFRYRDSCSQFIACYRKKPRLLTCKKGFFFNEASQDCIYFKNVTNCKNIIYSF